MSTETLTWTFPTENTAVPPVALNPSDSLTANVFDSASATPSVPIGMVMGNPGGPGIFTTPALPVGDNKFTVTVTDGTVTSAPSNVVEQVVTPAPAPPAAVTNLSGTFNP